MSDSGKAKSNQVDIGDQNPVGGNEDIQRSPFDLPRLMDILRQGLPEDDPTPTELTESLYQFKNFHQRLSEWKELHSRLNDILFSFGQFSRELERLSVYHEDPEPHTIGMHWRPISQKVASLLDWASAPRNIYQSEPFARLEDRVVGPSWAIELSVAGDRLDHLVQPNEPPRLFILPRDSRPTRPLFVDINELYDAGGEFFDIAERSLFLADRQMHEVTTELMDLSQIVLGGLESQ